jgi:hypothetical protein
MVVGGVDRETVNVVFSGARYFNYFSDIGKSAKAKI